MALPHQDHLITNHSMDPLDDAEKGQYENEAGLIATPPFVYLGPQDKSSFTSRTATPVSFYNSTTPASSVPELSLPWPAESQPDVKDKLEKIAPVSAKPKKKTSRWIRFDLWFNTYRKFFTLIILLNLAGIIMAALGRFPYAENHMGALVLGNLLCAILMRNELWMRFLYMISIYGLRSVSPIFTADLATANKWRSSGLRCA